MECDTPDMFKLAKYHWSYLPVWTDGNAYLNGAKSCKNEKNRIVSDEKAYAEIEVVNGSPMLKTNVYDYIGNFRSGLVTSDTLGEAFEPEQRFETPDGSDIVFDTDYFGAHRGAGIIPGPFAVGGNEIKELWYCI